MAVGDNRVVVIEQAGLKIDGLVGQLDLRRVQRTVAGWTITAITNLDDAFVVEIVKAAKKRIEK
ncbi:hypothetical protein D3C81_2259800 [compost metagenome]